MTCLHGKTLGVQIIVAPTVGNRHVCGKEKVNVTVIFGLQTREAIRRAKGGEDAAV